MSNSEDSDQESADFISPSRKRVKTDASLEEDEHSECLICMEPYTLGGEHRSVSVKCGHIFGRSCIIKWMQATRKTGSEKSKCPSCKGNINRRDIRPVYATRVSAIDAQDLEQVQKEKELLQQELNQLREKCTALETENAGIKLVSESRALEIDRLNKDMFKLQHEIFQLKEQMEGAHGSFVLSKSVSLEGLPSYSRVILSDPSFNDIIVTAAIHPEKQGIWRIKCQHVDIKEFIPIHKGTIRDARLYPWDPHRILTVSLDKKIKFTSLTSKQCLTEFNVPSAPWSCCWDTQNEHQMYIGTVDNSIFSFDLRKLSTSLACFQNDSMGGKGKGIHSLDYVETESFKGILGGSIKNAFCYNPSNGLVIPFEEPGFTCTSMRFDSKSQQWLSSFRMGDVTRHSIGTMDTTLIPKSTIDIPYRHSILSRSIIWTWDETFIGLTGDSLGKTRILNSNLDINMELHSTKPVMDILPYQVGSQHGIITLQDQQLSFYKY